MAADKSQQLFSLNFFGNVGIEPGPAGRGERALPLWCADPLSIFICILGSDSLATSLSSLDTAVSERDWEETFRALGPKFAAMIDDDATPVGSEEDDSYSEDGTEI